MEEERPSKIRRHLPPGSGEYSVGCVDMMSDNSETGVFFRMFYPIEKTDIYKRNTQWPLWLPRKQYGVGYAHFIKRNYTKLFGRLINWIGGDVYVPALWQAPVLENNEKIPVVILSHGIGGNRTTYSTFCLELASHGFLVAAIEHRDGSASMTYNLKDSISERITAELIRDSSSGKHRRHTIHKSFSFQEDWKAFEHTDPLGINWDDYDYRNKQVHQRADECSRLLNVLTDIDTGISVRNVLGFQFNLKQFKDRLDLSRVAFAGHSFGGSTLVAALGSDDRFKVGIMLDAWMHPLDQDLCNSVAQPVLMINYEKFQWRKNVEQMEWMEKTDADRTVITLKGACHQACSDFQFLVNKPIGKFLEVRNDLSPKKAMSLNTKASLSFLWKHLGFEGKEYHEDILTGNHELVIQGLKFGRKELGKTP